MLLPGGGKLAPTLRLLQDRRWIAFHLIDSKLIGPQKRSSLDRLCYRPNTGAIQVNQSTTTSVTAVPLHILLRQRRRALSLRQSELAEALHVSPECITQWECGRRRMELSKLPRIAAALHMNPRQLCAKALAEFHPLFYATLFSDSAAEANIPPGPA